MKQTVNFNTFHDAFMSIRPNNFTYDGLKTLFDHLEQYEQDTGEEIELDVIALCCEYSESTWEEVRQDYALDDDVDAMEFLENETIVCGTYEDSGKTFVVYLNF